ncbi:MAG TPA: fumarylacetoacetate hydrolase family protein [Bauldia sp.]|nr:fumarylacetoacetate hydrolase family protein [Bauldia sp.]
MTDSQAFVEGRSTNANVEEAARLLSAAWRSGVRLVSLPPSAKPATLDEAHAIQLETARLLGEKIGGWKVGVARPVRGAVLASRLLPSPAKLHAATMLRRLVEGEVAFIFDRPLPARGHDYSRNEVADAVSACVAIEVVDSRYQDQAAEPELDRIADFFGNSALVLGPPVHDWRSLPFATIHVSLSIDGKALIDQRGGHGSGDPLQACVLFVNAMRLGAGVPAGTAVTTGTYTGAPMLPVGSTAEVVIEGLGSAQVTFVP